MESDWGRGPKKCSEEGIWVCGMTNQERSRRVSSCKEGGRRRGRREEEGQKYEGEVDRAEFSLGLLAESLTSLGRVGCEAWRSEGGDEGDASSREKYVREGDQTTRRFRWTLFVRRVRETSFPWT